MVRIKIKQKIKSFFAHKNLYGFSIYELNNKRRKANQNILMDVGNSIIVSCVAGVLYYYGYETYSILFFITTLAFIMSIVDDKQLLYQIDNVIYEKIRRKEDGEQKTV